MIKHALTALSFSAACVVAPAAVAEAGDRHHQARHVCSSHVVPGHYETVERRVKVPGGQICYEDRQVTVPGRYKTVTKTVQIPGRYEAKQVRVWVPERWVEHSSHRRPKVRVEAGPVTLKFNGRRYSNRRLVPGHYETRTQRVWIPPTTEQRQVREWCPPTTRTERVAVRKPAYRIERVRIWVPAQVETCCTTSPRRVTPRHHTTPVRGKVRRVERRDDRADRRDRRGDRRYERRDRRSDRRGARISLEFGR